MTGMSDNTKPLTQVEYAALLWIKTTTCNLVSMIPDKTELNVFGDKVPGMATFKKLAKRGYCFETEEEPVRFTDDPDEVPFDFTPSIEMTDEGLAALKTAMASGRY